LKSKKDQIILLKKKISNMEALLLFVPVIFSAGAQILVKFAANHEIKSINWFIFIGLSMVSYVVAFVLYSFTVRHFPINIASPVNTISVMIIVVAFGLFIGEVLSVRQLVGVAFGLVAIVLLLLK
jgi:drug/metabolite transporter (DMT)-like permease